MANLTQRALRESLRRLLNRKPFDKITVKDIVESCGINRNTFYYHYEDIYALLKDLFETEIEEMTPGGTDELLWQESVIRAARFAMENKKLVYHVYNSVRREELERYLFEVSERSMDRFVREQARGLDVSEDDIFLITVFYKHAVVGTFQEWLQSNMKTEPEEFIVRLGELLKGDIRHSLERAAGKGPAEQGRPGQSGAI